MIRKHSPGDRSIPIPCKPVIPFWLCLYGLPCYPWKALRFMLHITVPSQVLPVMLHRIRRVSGLPYGIERHVLRKCSFAAGFMQLYPLPGLILLFPSHELIACAPRPVCKGERLILIIHLFT